jgi:hypothetical protein
LVGNWLVQAMPCDVVSGAVFAVTPDEMQNADKYEVAAVKRVAVVLQSGDSRADHTGP